MCPTGEKRPNTTHEQQMLVVKGFGKVTRQFVRTLYSPVCFNKPPPELHSGAEKGRSQGNEVPLASHYCHAAETESMSLNVP